VGIKDKNMRYLKAIVIFGWALPLFGSFNLLSTKLNCVSRDVVCSFPFLDTANNLILISFVWLIASIIVYVKTQN